MIAKPFLKVCIVLFFQVIQSYRVQALNHHVAECQAYATVMWPIKVRNSYRLGLTLRDSSSWALGPLRKTCFFLVRCSATVATQLFWRLFNSYPTLLLLASASVAFASIACLDIVKYSKYMSTPCDPKTSKLHSGYLRASYQYKILLSSPPDRHFHIKQPLSSINLQTVPMSHLLPYWSLRPQILLAQCCYR